MIEPAKNLMSKQFMQSLGDSTTEIQEASLSVKRLRTKIEGLIFILKSVLLI